jgi:hypothetical protein
MSGVETALEERQVPDLKYARVEWPEGGMLSDRREYLRITRERLDVCGAPFGTGFFVPSGSARSRCDSAAWR